MTKTEKKEFQDRQAFLAACKVARELSVKEGKWYLVYRSTRRQRGPVYRSVPSAYLSVKPKTFSDGWQGEVVATYNKGENWD